MGRASLPIILFVKLSNSKVQLFIMSLLLSFWFFYLEEEIRVSMIPGRPYLEHRLFPHDSAIPGLEKPFPNQYFPVGADEDFSIITAGSHGYVDRLENMIGSIHFYEPDVNIVVIDMGLTAAQRAHLGCLRQVTVSPFDFLKYPDHVRHLDNYAWKPILIKELYDAYPNGFLYMDSGTELWQSLHDFMTPLRQDGYFFTIQETLVATIHPETVAHLKLELEFENIANQSHLWAGLMGLSKKHSPPTDIEEILVQWSTCAMQAECISPPGADLTNHKYDQSVLSLLFRSRQAKQFYNSLRVHSELRWWLDWIRVGYEGSDELTLGGAPQFFSRRYHCPKPYATKVQPVEDLAECLAEKGANTKGTGGGWFHPLLFRGGDIAERRPWRCPEKINLVIKFSYLITVALACLFGPGLFSRFSRLCRSKSHTKGSILPTHVGENANFPTWMTPVKVSVD